MLEKSIYVIDDEPNIQTLFSEALTRHGYAVKGSLDGETALKYFARKEPGMIFLDLKLPGIDGVQTLLGIRKKYPKVPVIIITGYPRDGLVEAALKEGVFACLIKPFGVRDVLAILETLELMQAA